MADGDVLFARREPYEVTFVYQSLQRENSVWVSECSEVPRIVGELFGILPYKVSDPDIQWTAGHRVAVVEKPVFRAYLERKKIEFEKYAPATQELLDSF